MSTTKDQDETSGFISESEDMPEIETESQDDTEEEQASSSEVDNDDEGSAESEDEAIDSDNETDSLADDASAEPEKAGKAKKSNKVQERINEVIRQRETAKRENESLQKRIKELEGKGKDSAHKEEEPIESDFDTYDEYLSALDQFDSSNEANETNKEHSKQEETKKDNSNQLTDSQLAAMEVIKELIANDESKPEDFDAVALDPSVPITGEMLEAIAECDNATAVMMKLGNDKALASSIANKTAAQQMREIAKLDLTVNTRPPKPVKATNAPDPINPLKGGDVQKKPLSKMSYAEFEAADRERNKNRKSTW